MALRVGVSTSTMKPAVPQHQSTLHQVLATVSSSPNTDHVMEDTNEAESQSDGGSLTDVEAEPTNEKGTRHFP